jgi:hypothetical protein
LEKRDGKNWLEKKVLHPRPMAFLNKTIKLYCKNAITTNYATFGIPLVSVKSITPNTDKKF